MIKAQKHNWIGKPGVELPGIILLPFVCCALIFCLPSSFLQTDVLPEYTWLFLIVFVDVGHVYSTLYRTYIDKPLVLKNKNLFFGLPVLLLLLSIVLHSVNSLWFWRALAYLAVFHFIRQQYGFLRIYSRKNTYSRTKQLLDNFTIHAVTLLPLIFWHFSGNRSFHWFVKGDFILGSQPPVLITVQILFWLTLSIYTLSEINTTFKSKAFNFQKNAIVYGTALAWYAGIVYFNSDVVFSLLNIICHGIPYMALVWIHGKKKHSSSENPAKLFRVIYGQFSLLFFILPLLLFAWFEEGFWNAFVWNDHDSVFPLFNLVHVDVPRALLNIIVPLLALPQLFHYVIDGYIWKMRNDKFEWSKIL